MIVSNVLHRPIRTAVSILAVAIEVGMVMMVVGLTSGLLNDSRRRVEGMGADVLVQPPNASFIFSLSQTPMPNKIREHLAHIEHVRAVTPVLFQPSSTSGLTLIWGIDMPSFAAVTGGFVYHSGGPFTGPNDLLVDDWYAKANHLVVGQKISLINQEFRVAGIVEHGKGGRIFIPLDTAEDLSGAHDKASIFFVKVTDPAYTDEVIQAIRQLRQNYQILSIPEYMSLMTSNNLPPLEAFITVMISIAVAIGFLVIFLSMYTTITERTREIGILKSLGASKRYIISVILREAGLLSVIGILAGYGVAVMARKLVITSFPTLNSIELTVGWGFRAALLAMADPGRGFLPRVESLPVGPGGRFGV
jgi:putative ABC transport system permease protein